MAPGGACGALARGQAIVFREMRRMAEPGGVEWGGAQPAPPLDTSLTRPMHGDDTATSVHFGIGNEIS